MAAVTGLEMHLVLRSDSGESITLEVLQDDSFEDLSNRLYERGKISVDLKQLSSDGKPFEMTANVMDYFRSIKGNRRKENQMDLKQEETAPFSQEPDTTTETSTLPDDMVETLVPTSMASMPDISKTDIVSLKDDSPEQEIMLASSMVDEDGQQQEQQPEQQLLLEQHSEESQPLLSEQLTETTAAVAAAREPIEEKRDAEREKCLPKRYCRLCACTIQDGAKFIFEVQVPSDSSENQDDDHADTLADKINEALPILVSKEDELPKQVCLACLEGLNATHAFRLRVSAADEQLKKMLYTENKFEENVFGENDPCPLCYEGLFELVPYEEAPCIKEEYEDEEQEESNEVPGGGGGTEQGPNGDMGGGGDYDEYEEGLEGEENSYIQPKKRGRPRGSRSLKRQYPWDDLDDEDWTLKEETVVKKRGRPKGSKNKTNQQEQPTQCGLCYTWHPDMASVMAHTLEVHCIDETGTFPCPLCKAIQPDEGELIHHVTNHNHLVPPKVKMWGCPLCGQVYDVQDELGGHLLSDHVQAASPQYQCPLCDHAPTSGARLANHITDSHCGPPTWNCPLCDEGHEGKQTALDHVVRSHVSMAAQTTQCPLCEMQFITDEEMAQHLLDRHSSATVVDRPTPYTCTACNSRFKTQHSLVKHSCPVRNNKKLKKSTYSRY